MNLTSIVQRFSLPILVSSAVLASAGTALAQNAIYTEIVGFKTETIRGDGSLSYIGMNLLEEPIYDGIVTASTENTLELAGVNLSDLLDPFGHYFVDVIRAENENAVGLNTSVTDWNGSTIALADDLSDLLTPGVDRIRIHRLPTVGEIFGEGGDVLQGGTTNTADMVYLPDPAGNGVIALYYSQSPIFGTGWRQVGVSGDKSDTPVYFTDGIYVSKRSAGDVTLAMFGTVKSTRTVIAVPQGSIPYSSVYPGGLTLGNSGLFDAQNPLQSLQAGTSTNADAILMDADGDGQPEMYYYSQSPIFGTGWRQVGVSGDKSDMPLSSGFVIVNRNGPISITLNPAH